MLRRKFLRRNVFFNHYKTILTGKTRYGKAHIKKSGFSSGRTTKGVRRVNSPDLLAKKHFFSKIRLFQPKNWKEKEKIVDHGPLSHWCREGKTLVIRPLKKTHFFMCVFPKDNLFQSIKKFRVSKLLAKRFGNVVRKVTKDILHQKSLKRSTAS